MPVYFNAHELGVPQNIMRRERIFFVLVFTYSTVLLSADTPVVELSRDKHALLSVVIGSEVSEATKATATELAKYLGLMSGAEFKVETGDGSTGIVLGRPAEFNKLPLNQAFSASPFEREDYLIRSHAQGLYLLGASDLAVSHAAWDLLYRLGYRQFFPGPTWEIIPAPADLKISIDTHQCPSFHARRIWYNWGLWGYNDEPYRNWCVRNRIVKGFDLQSGHSYENIIAANKAEFDSHPEYIALVGDERKIRGDVKFCISNPGLRKLVAGHAVRFFKAHPAADSISMDPSDGDNWCECDACAQMGSISDRVVTLANTVAEAINDPALGLTPKYVGIYAYNKHSAPPHIKINPHVIPSATTAFIGGGFTFEQVLQGWQAQGGTMGVYDYLSVVDWDWNLPRGGAASRPFTLSANLARFHKMGARFYDAESGDCWGPCGLGYFVASRVLWDVNEAQNTPALVDDFIEKSFEGAKEPMREFYRLICEDKQRRSPSDILGRMYRQLDAARHSTQNPKVLQRLDDLTLYTRYTELYYAYSNSAGKMEDVARYAYRMRKTMMIHCYGLWSRLISQKAALDPKHPLKSDEPFKPDELARFISDGIARNKPVEPGFTSVEYSRNLVPAATKLNLPKVAGGSFPNAPQDRQRYYIWVPKDLGSVNLKITVEKVWATRAPKISLFSPLEVTLDPVASDESYKPDSKQYDITLKTPHFGLHRIETWDGGDHTNIVWTDGVPVTIESGIDTTDLGNHFRGGWTLYFYVPKGTAQVAGWAARVANWAPPLSGKVLDGGGHEVFNFAHTEGGWFKIPVPAGQDGKLWKFENNQGMRQLMTVPPYLARSSDELLLPSEIVDADAAQPKEK